MSRSGTAYRPGQLDPPGKSPNTIRNIPYGQPCPICGHKDGWCSRYEDSGNIICKRVESNMPCRNDGGWTHIVNHDFRPRSQSRSTPIEPPITYDSPPGIHERHGQQLLNITPQLRQLASKDLHVSAEALCRLGLGFRFDDRRFPYGAWTWPMVGPAGQLIGLKYRCTVTGDKITGPGGHNGLFVPSDLHVDGDRLLVCEGVTDTAAALDLGYRAIGRDGCSGLHRHVADFARIHKPADIVIVADNDAPGQRGAWHLAYALVPLGRPVRVVTPPPGIKDLRQWFLAGASRSDVLRQIDWVEPIMVEVI